MEQFPEHLDTRQRAGLAYSCLYCLKSLGGDDGSKDHVPSKVLVGEPYPPNLPTVLACGECNNGFSADEQYVHAFLGCVLSGSADPDDQADPAVSDTLARNPKLRARIAGARRGTGGAPLWQPETKRIEAVLIKNARGHLWFECAEIWADAPAVRFHPIDTASKTTKYGAFDSPSDLLLAEVGSRHIQRILSADAVHGWIVVREGRYRFAIDLSRDGGVSVRSVISEYLATQVVWPCKPN